MEEDNPPVGQEDTGQDDVAMDGQVQEDIDNDEDIDDASDIAQDPSALETAMASVQLQPQRQDALNGNDGEGDDSSLSMDGAEDVLMSSSSDHEASQTSPGKDCSWTYWQ